MSVTSPTFLFIWLAIFLPILVVVGWAVISFVRHGPSQRVSGQTAKAAAKSSESILAQLKAANDFLSAVVSVQQQAITAISVLPEDVMPEEAERTLRRQLPDAALDEKFQLMLWMWEREKRPQALAALAGMAFADPDNQSGLLAVGLRHAVEQGGPALLEAIALEIEDRCDALDKWLQDGGLVVRLERASERVEAEAPQVAATLRRVVATIEPRTRANLMRQLRWNIEHMEEADPSDFDIRPDAAAMAKRWATYCLPRFPELLEEAYAVLGRHEGAEWRIAQVHLISLVLYRFADLRLLAGFDYDLAVTRLCQAIASSDAQISEAAASEIASLVNDHFFDHPHMFVALRTALETAQGLHGDSAIYGWLAEELEPPEDRDVRLKEAMALQERAAETNAGIKTVTKATASLDPAVVLAELRTALPDTPVEGLRVGLIARWQLEREVVCLVALVGLVIEAVEGGSSLADRVVHLLHWPLKEGPDAVVEAAVALVTERFALLDGWIHDEASVRDLELAAVRMGGDTKEKVFGLLSRVQARRVELLDASIGARLAVAQGQGEGADCFQLVLDSYRWCLPAHPALGAPVRQYLRRRDDAAGRKAGLWLESLVIKHFTALGWLHGYDVDALVALLHDRIEDYEFEVAAIAGSLAQEVVTSGLVRTDAHLHDLQGALDWADNLHPSLPESFAALQDALASAWARRASVP